MKQRRSLESHLNYLDTLLLVFGDPLWFLLEPLELLLTFEGLAVEEVRATVLDSLTLVREVDSVEDFLTVVFLVVLVVVLALDDFLVVTALDEDFPVSVVLCFVLVDLVLSSFTSTGRASLAADFLVSVGLLVSTGFLASADFLVSVE
jgi:hypothetical protein